MRSEGDGAELQTPRLHLRGWRDEDLDELAALCADPLVMRYFPAPLNREQSGALLSRLQQHFAQHGFTFWSLWHREDGRFVGMTGLAHVGFEASFTPAVEIGWRLSPAFWGLGLAQEAARASLEFAFTQLALDRVVAFTTLTNTPSQRVMQAIGMQPSSEFKHPALAPEHPLCRHVLYEIPRDKWPKRG
ncbi:MULTISPECIES: GNAT family N-acetyltransferase [unclassified Pseudomonas]|uniref:GNAT family N-acetyltransferase n=1 Tax=unclassified Pseudomonas TaxID=196821 RepID=UPI000DAC6D87|nr:MULTISPECIES: GNAT family N-acetyltransferase [unclassified Pseudomonas]MBD9657428.1 GNAT family N-acetyltransferase [Pseudomonas sp. PDM12]PZW42769.1 RimJ/RimL family protein N-acetyltransferase [Pseudomonas sp. URMO17WK12:I2]